jgi:hypothetical protein
MKRPLLKKNALAKGPPITSNEIHPYCRSSKLEKKLVNFCQTNLEVRIYRFQLDM